MSETEKLTYTNFVIACKKIAKEIPSNITGLYGVPRGGLIPAVYLSHITKLPLVDKPGKNVLIIDDIADTGNTLLDLKLHMSISHFKAMTIYYHKQSIIEPEFWVYEKEDKWIQFPWEL